MFDSVLDRGVVPRRRLGTGATVSVLAHAALLSAALLFRPPPPVKEAEKVIVWPEAVQFQPPPAAAATRTPAQRAPPRQTAMLVSATAPTTPPPEVEPPPDFGPSPDASPMEGTRIGGPLAGPAADGPPGAGGPGVPGGTCTGDDCPTTFERGMMTAPVLLDAGRDPTYTREALEARVEGQMTVQCVVTLEGRLEQCRLFQALPYMERAVVEALMTRRYAPATRDGRPLAVRYSFRVKLELPR